MCSLLNRTNPLFFKSATVALCGNISALSKVSAINCNWPIASVSHANNGEDVKPFTHATKLLRVAVIGVPNAGKSTLINQLVEHDVCPVSKRVHTTRKNQKAIYLKENTQIVFVDTPGVVNMKEIKKFAFTKKFVHGPERSINVADVVAVVHDVSNKICRNRLDRRVLAVLETISCKDVVLILNKVDILKQKQKLLETINLLTRGIVAGKPIPMEPTVTRAKRLTTSQLLQRAKERAKQYENDIENKETSEIKPIEQIFTGACSAEKMTSKPKKQVVETEDTAGWTGFQDVFVLSALKGNGIDVLKDYLVRNAKESEWDFTEDVLTDFSPQDLALRILKSKMLEILPNHIPYVIKPVLEFWDEDSEGYLVVSFKVSCENDYIKNSVIGVNGVTKTLICTETENNLIRILKKNVTCYLNVFGNDGQ